MTREGSQPPVEQGSQGLLGENAFDIDKDTLVSSLQRLQQLGQLHFLVGLVRDRQHHPIHISDLFPSGQSDAILDHGLRRFG